MITKEQAIIGAIVIRSDYDDRFYYGKIINIDCIDSDNTVDVKWNNSVHTYDLDELIIADVEADKKHAIYVQSKLDEAASAFEKAFSIFKEIQYHPNGALYELKSAKLIDPSALEDAVNTGGWSTSSLYC